MADEGVQRRLAAVMSADVVGYRRHMGRDEVGTRRRFKALLDRVIRPRIADYHGRIVKTIGDGLLVEFASVVDAVRCAAAFQEALNVQAPTEKDSETMSFRVGVNLGDVIVENSDIHGDGVNVAARLEGLAEAGGVVVSDIVHEIVRAKVDFEFEDLGLQDLKNIAEPVRAFRIAGLASDAQDRHPNGASGPAPPKRPESPSIVVLPFVNSSEDSEQEYFADGITDDLITDLSKSSGLFVVARNSSFAFKGTTSNSLEVARRLGVRHVLEGSVRRAGNRIRINARLVDGQTGGQVWAERYDGELDDVFDLQDEITGRIMLALKGRLHAADPGGSVRTRPGNSKAYDLCLKGRWAYYSYSPANLANARQYFEQAIMEDPAYAEAYAYLSYCRTTAHVFTWPGADDTLEEPLALAQKAVSLDPGSAFAHARRGWILGFMGRFAEARQTFEKAIELEPRNAEALYAFGETMNRGGEPERALPILEKAFSVDRFFPPSWEFAKAHSFILMRRYEEGLEILLPVIARAPRLVPARIQLARAYGEMGQMADAEAAVREILKIAPNYRISSAARMFPYPTKADRERLLDTLRHAGLPS